MRRHLNSFRSFHLLKYVRELLSPKAFKATNPPENIKNIQKQNAEKRHDGRGTEGKRVREAGLTDWRVSSHTLVRFRFPIRIQYQSELSESGKNIQFP